MVDVYQDFSELQQHENRYSIELCDRGSPVTIVAPHGGDIEPHTAEIARLIAADDFNCYCFLGRKGQDNRTLHITSHRFDEPAALAIVRRSTTVLAVHGCTRTEPLIVLGGRDETLLARLYTQLSAHGITSQRGTRRWAGTHVDNICNRGRTGRGAQLEISRPLRDSPDRWRVIATAVRAALSGEAPHKPSAVR